MGVANAVALESIAHGLTYAPLRFSAAPIALTKVIENIISYNKNIKMMSDNK